MTWLLHPVNCQRSFDLSSCRSKITKNIDDVRHPRSQSYILSNRNVSLSYTIITWILIISSMLDINFAAQLSFGHILDHFRFITLHTANKAMDMWMDFAYLEIYSTSSRHDNIESKFNIFIIFINKYHDKKRSFDLGTCDIFRRVEPVRRRGLWSNKENQLIGKIQREFHSRSASSRQLISSRHIPWRRHAINFRIA